MNNNKLSSFTLTTAEAIEFNKLLTGMRFQIRRMTWATAQCAIGGAVQLAASTWILASLLSGVAPPNLCLVVMGFGAALIFHGCHLRRVYFRALHEQQQALMEWMVRTDGRRGEPIPAWMLWS